jgi:hypothetical protein
MLAPKPATVAQRWALQNIVSDHDGTIEASVYCGRYTPPSNLKRLRVKGATIAKCIENGWLKETLNKKELMTQYVTLAITDEGREALREAVSREFGDT